MDQHVNLTFLYMVREQRRDDNMKQLLDVGGHLGFIYIIGKGLKKSQLPSEENESLSRLTAAKSDPLLKTKLMVGDEENF